MDNRLSVVLIAFFVILSGCETSSNIDVVGLHDPEKSHVIVSSEAYSITQSSPNGNVGDSYFMAQMPKTHDAILVFLTIDTYSDTEMKYHKGSLLLSGETPFFKLKRVYMREVCVEEACHIAERYRSIVSMDLINGIRNGDYFSLRLIAPDNESTVDIPLKRSEVQSFMEKVQEVRLSISSSR